MLLCWDQTSRNTTVYPKSSFVYNDTLHASATLECQFLPYIMPRHDTVFMGYWRTLMSNTEINTLSQLRSGLKRPWKGMDYPHWAPLSIRESSNSQEKAVVLTYVARNFKDKKATDWKFRFLGFDDDQSWPVTAGRPMDFVDMFDWCRSSETLRVTVQRKGVDFHLWKSWRRWEKRTYMDGLGVMS